jgi:hypothetical protein
MVSYGSPEHLKMEIYSRAEVITDQPPAIRAPYHNDLHHMIWAYIQNSGNFMACPLCDAGRYDDGIDPPYPPR